MFYKYKNESICYTIYANRENSSIGAKEEDKLVKQYVIDSGEVKINIDVYELPEHASRYVASFEYQGVHYELKGTMEQQEFDKILKNLYFL